MSKSNPHIETLLVTWLSVIAVALVTAGCDPKPHFEINNVTITSHPEVISSGFVEHVFSTNKDAYYLIGIEKVRNGYNPLDPGNQKQFMTLELDSAHLEYLDWRRRLLQEGEFNIASFASHALQYGETDYYFTGLQRSTEYWVYAFVVDPERLTPVGKLHAVKVRTTELSTFDIHFAYRIKGEWDYVYPQDSKGHIEAHYPYLIETVDSIDLAENASSPQQYFHDFQNLWLLNPQDADILYGVYTRQNNGFGKALDFEEGHTYYTFICGYDDGFFHPTLYKFRWKDASTELYLTDSEENNLFIQSDRW
ncbi:MAG: hypothetical protein IJ718_03780 [Paludibacteraceae bacterium]|nr:hypothetical protein [Paludibacteraceae bacterium]